MASAYDSTTYFGNFTYNPSPRSALSISVYDGVTGFGGVLNNALAGLSSDFVALRNPVTGDFGGLVTGEEGSGLINSLGSVRSAAFRGSRRKCELPAPDRTPERGYRCRI